jgi:hypothetical protein
VRGLDATFLERVQKCGFAAVLVALLVSLQWASMPLSLGILTGWLVSAGILRSWQWVAVRAFGPERARPGLIGALLLLKLPVLGVVVWLLLAQVRVDPFAFAFGTLIPQVTIVLLALGGRRVRGGPGRGERIHASHSSGRKHRVPAHTTEGGGHVGSCA